MFLKRLKQKEATKIVFESEDEFIDFQRSIGEAFPATNGFVRACADRWLNGIDSEYQAHDPVEDGRPSAILQNSEIVDMIPMICSLVSDSSHKATVDRTKYGPSAKYNELMQKYAELEEALRGSASSSERQKKEFELQNLRKEKESLTAENTSTNQRYMTALGNISAALIKGAVADVSDLAGYDTVLTGNESVFSSVSYKSATKQLENSIIVAINNLITKENQSRIARINAEKRATETEQKNRDLTRIADALIAKQNKFNAEVANVEPLLSSIKESAEMLYAIFLAEDGLTGGVQPQIPQQAVTEQPTISQPESKTVEPAPSEVQVDEDDIDIDNLPIANDDLPF